MGGVSFLFYFISYFFTKTYVVGFNQQRLIIITFCFVFIRFFNSFTAIGDKKAFANSIEPDETAHNEPSHLVLRCLTFSLSTIHINLFKVCLKNKKKSRRQMSSEIWHRKS